MLDRLVWFSYGAVWGFLMVVVPWPAWWGFAAAGALTGLWARALWLDYEERRTLPCEDEGDAWTG